MENTGTDKSLFDINFDENVKFNLKGAALWGGIAAIVSLVGSIIGLIDYFVQRQKIKRIYSSYGDIGLQQPDQTGGFVSVFISLVIGIVLFVFLNKFSKKTKLGVDTNDQYLINEGLRGLSAYFKTMGILVIIVIVLSLLGVLIALGGG